MKKLKEWFDDNTGILLYVIHIIVAILALIAGILMIIYAFSNPELTKTQIIAHAFKTKWWAYVPVCVVAIVDHTVINSNSTK